MKSLIAALLVVFSSSAFASTDTAKNLDCRNLVATTAVMITNRIPSNKGKVKSIVAPVDKVQYQGGSATIFISQVGDEMNMISGKDQWSVEVVRTGDKGVEGYTYAATTRPDAKGQCMMMEITMIDKRT